jgi:tetratricopeptide (TPR) repeat protein
MVCWFQAGGDGAIAGTDNRQRSARKVARWARSHLLLWITFATTIDASLVVLIPVLISLPGHSKATISGLITLLLVLLAFSIALPIVGQVINDRDQAVDREHKQLELVAEAEQDRREKVDRLLIHTIDGRLPRLSELADSDLGATPTRYSIKDTAPYVSRGDADLTIRKMLSTLGPPYPFVLVWGSTKSGKSRTLTEAIRATFTSDPEIILPRNGQALFELAKLDFGDLVGSPPAIVVLDDLDPAGLDALTHDVLHMVRQSAAIVATMTSQRRADVLRTGSEVGKIAQAALAAVTGEYELSSEPPSGTQRVQAERLYPTERFDGSIAETLVGARELIARYKASHDTHPLACAALRAAIDCRRAGILRPVTEVELLRLFPIYLRAVRIDLTPTKERLAAALDWAATPIASQVALLQRANPGKEPSAWIIFDHAVTADEGDSEYLPRPIPNEIWNELIDEVSADDAFYIGFSADARKQTFEAMAAFQKAQHSGLVHIASLAALRLAHLLDDQGDITRARAAYSEAISRQHPDIVPLAAIGLGTSLAKQDPEGARAAYQIAVSSCHPDLSPMAASYLGILLGRQGDVAGARAAYEIAISSGDSDVAVPAAMNLGLLLEDVGDLAEACAAFEFVIDSSNAEFKPDAALFLGNLYTQQGNTEAARIAFQVAADSNDADRSSFAAITLGNMLSQQGDVDGARAAYQQVIDRPESPRKALATLLLGILHSQQGNDVDARAAYQLVIDSGIAGLDSIGMLLLEAMNKHPGHETDAQAAQQMETGPDLDIAAIITGLMTNPD